MARKVEDWISGFEKYLNDKGSPSSYVTWAALSTIASALERKVWVKTRIGYLYPNLFVLLIGNPGVGKTLVTRASRNMLLSISDETSNTINIAPVSVTKASLIDSLYEAKRSITSFTSIPPVTTFNSLSIISDEFGVFLPAYDVEFTSTLTNLFDCDVYSEKRRTSKTNIKMDRPHLNMLGATTPSYLSGLARAGAYDQGFMSRTISVYSGAIPPQALFGENEFDKELYKHLSADLLAISNLEGAFNFTDEAIKAIEEWHLKGGEPTPRNPRLRNYNTRRTTHLLKLCMIVSASRSDEQIVKEEDFKKALNLLEIAEDGLEDMFKVMSNGDTMEILEECMYKMYKLYLKNNSKPIATSTLTQYLVGKIPVSEIQSTLILLEKAEWIKMYGNGKQFIPSEISE